MQNKLTIFKSLFKGRNDVYAVRWEKEGKGGYMPAYDIDWQQYALHKAKGGSFKDYPDKKIISLTDDTLINHLSGKETIGVYPLLEDNTSWFIAADFDQGTTKNKSWMEDCEAFIAECSKYQLPVYLERSRSGNGGHVWLFFEQPVSAGKSRKLFLTLLANASLVSAADKSSNFDRLFPNQDAHSGKGFGNLIALPLQKKALENKNSCFIDPASGEPFPDQWEFLKKIKKISSVRLEEIVSGIATTPILSFPVISSAETEVSFSTDITITLSNEVVIPRNGVNSTLLNYLRDNLNFLNSDYIFKKKAGIDTHNVQGYFKCLNETGTRFDFPRGFTGKLLRFCKENNITYTLIDKRATPEQVEFNSGISLYNYQKAAVEATDKKDFGVIVAPPGAGKTIIALSILANKQLPALIIVHRKQLFDQWIERIESFLNIPKYRIGKIAGEKCEPGNEITVAMMQAGFPEHVYSKFGIVIVDECHHIPAKTFRDLIQKFNSYYLYGFTATPFRKGGDEKLIFIYLGDIIHRVELPAIEENANRQLSVVVKDTAFFVPFDVENNSDALASVLIHDTARNELIVTDILKEAVAGRRVLVLTERKAHVNILHQYLKGSIDVIAVTGEDVAQQKKKKLQQIKEGSFQVLITTGQFMGEGADVNVLDCLVLAYPFSFEGKLIQYIGRVQRSANSSVIYDYKDHKITFLDKQFKKRNKYYRKLAKSGQLKSLDELVLVFDRDKFYIEHTENIFSIDHLDLPLPVEQFLPGVCWKIRVVSYNEDDGILICEIIDYKYTDNNKSGAVASLFYSRAIEKIKFRSIDTAAFLNTVVLKKQETIKRAITKESPTENVILKNMKVPFRKIRLLHGVVSFPLFIKELEQELTFEIANAAIRPEFEAIKNYFSNVLKKKLLTVDIAIRYSAQNILSATAKSEDIEAINSHLIDTVRFGFIKKTFFKATNAQFINRLNTIDSFFDVHCSPAKALFISEQQLVNDVLSIRQFRHFLQLQYLSSRHEAAIFKLRFVIQPFSFLFLVAGEKKYHIIWETLDSEEATYIWHTEKSGEALKKRLTDIEYSITDIRKSGRKDFLKQENADFSRVLHDYTDAKKGFITWKGLLEERLI